MRSCPVGSHITTLAECAEAYKQLKDMFRYPSLRGVVANENPGVGRGPQAWRRRDHYFLPAICSDWMQVIKMQIKREIG